MAHPTLFRRILLKIPFLLLTLSLCTIIPAVYISNEHTIHSWDDEAYLDMTIYKALTLRESGGFSPGNIRKEIAKVYYSTEKNYSELHTLLICPVILLFGPSRVVYIVSLSLFYLFPLIITIGAIASSIVTSNKTRAFRIATLMAVFTPAIWLPTLHGYPDAGAAFLMAVSALLFIQDMELKTGWRLIAISFLLAIAVLFRRHYVYDIITFFVAVSVIQVYLAFITKQPAAIMLRKLIIAGLRVCLLGICMLLVLYLFGWPFIKRLLHNNFIEIYSSYERDISLSINKYLSYYGWLTIIIAIGGLCLAIFYKTNFFAPSAAPLFILVAGTYSVAQWIIKVKQISVHYTLHFTPWIVLGVFMAFWWMWHYFYLNRRVVLASFILFFGIIFIGTLFPVAINAEGNPNSGIANIILRALPANHSPSKRSDYLEILKLSSYLQSLDTTGTKPVFVAASSKLLNDDLLWHAHENIHEAKMLSASKDFWKGYKTNILHWVPFADSHANYPLPQMMKADYMIITKPFQHHLPVEQQKVIYSVARAFEEQWPYSKDFQLLPQTFTLSGPVKVYVYKRIQPTSIETLVLTYRSMQQYFKKPPGGKTDWIGLNKNNYYISLNENKTAYDIIVEIIEDAAPSILFLEKKVDKINLIKGNINFSSAETGPFTLQINLMDELGNNVFTETQNLPADKTEFRIFLKNIVPDYSFITLTVVPDKSHGRDFKSNYITFKNLEVQR